MTRVVIVESPAKAKTINKYLGSEFEVIASYGHVRDLPSKNGSVNPDDDFSMIWESDDRAAKQISNIAKAAKNADTIYLATDPDREGEAISWHIYEILKNKGVLNGKPIYRIVFNEITKTAVQHAISHPSKINQELVDAYLARRALDYLVGFTLSPVLWRKLPGSRSAGRVQSVALRLIVEREQEIERFQSQEYWSLHVDCLTVQKAPFTARLTRLDGKKVEKLSISNKVQAEETKDKINAQDFHIANIEKKQTRRNPAAPFITSTLQQEASRKLGLGASRTMQLAQKLYEGIDIGGETMGLISYMRTDSPTLSKEAVESLRDVIEKSYGASYLPKAPKVYKAKSKNAQEAHEAIRPTYFHLPPEKVRPFLDDALFRLYDLIWKRTLACQMESALFDQVVVDIQSIDKNITLRANGSTLVFDGFLKVYEEGLDQKSDDSEDENLLPFMSVNEPVEKKNISPEQHFTQPPPRYSEASLVKKLEELSIGRPSTYASIIGVLQDRSYVRLEKKQFIPQDRGRLVTVFLTNFFNKYVQYDFTADLEEELDDISSGDRQWKHVLQAFWEPFKSTVDQTSTLKIQEVLESLERDLKDYLFPPHIENARKCPTCAEGELSLKLGKFGAFLGCSNYPECKYTRPLHETAPSGEEDSPLPQNLEPQEIGIDPKTQAVITLRKGPYGYYLQWDGGQVVEPVAETPPAKGRKKKKETAPKPKRVSLPSFISPDQIDITIALKLGELPKVIGTHPETEESVSIGIGRFGPYIKCGSSFTSLPKSDNILEVTFERCLEIIQKKATKSPLEKKRVSSKKVASLIKE